MPIMDKDLKFFCFAIGIFVCYLYYGIMEERIMKRRYGEKKEVFLCVFSLVFIQCLTNWIYAEILLRTCMKQGKNVTPAMYLGSSAFMSISATAFSYKALQYVNYPTQVIGKCSKPIPVLVFGVLFGHRSYPIHKYFFVLLICIGVGLFVYKDDKMVSHEPRVDIKLLGYFGIGEMLLVGSLAMDGILGAIEERMIAQYNTNCLHMMSSFNIFALPFVALAIVYQGELSVFISFVRRYPSLTWDILTFLFASAQGELFIFLMIEHFGPLACSIVTTTRKFFSLVGSTIIYGNPINTRQVIATFIVFSGLFLDAFYGTNLREICDSGASEEESKPEEVVVKKNEVEKCPATVTVVD